MNLSLYTGEKTFKNYRKLLGHGGVIDTAESDSAVSMTPLSWAKYENLNKEPRGFIELIIKNTNTGVVPIMKKFKREIKLTKCCLST